MVLGAFPGGRRQGALETMARSEEVEEGMTLGHGAGSDVTRGTVALFCCPTPLGGGG
jgi:hypothetical protein